MIEEGRRIRLLDDFEAMKDPGIERCKRHSLLDIITVAICAVIFGADSWVDVEFFGKSKDAWFRTFLELPNGILSHARPFSGASLSARNSPGWTRSGSRIASWRGGRGWRSCCQGSWWPSIARRRAVPAVRASFFGMPADNNRW